uniref:Sorbin and SH3 domain containing 2 n=1 Tax=Meleagris gallopavo TaxID=9103 RepID=G1NFX5_MELGA
MNTDSGGCARKRAAMSVTLTAVKRVQSSPNLLASGSDSQSPDSAWRAYNDGSRETLNGDISSSSLTAKGFRSVRPNLQDKKSPTQLGNQKVTAPVMEVNATQTHRQTTTEASPLPLPPPVVPVNRASFSPDSGTHLVPYSLPTLDDFSRFYKTPTLSQFSYKCPFLASENTIHKSETASVSTDSAMSECSSRTMSESSTVILDELQTCSYDTTDCSETPSPTLSQMSAVSDGTTLTNTAATSNAQITVNGNSGTAASPVSHFQRPFSPSSAYSPPASLNSNLVIMQHGRMMESTETYSQHVGSSSTTSTIPICKSLEEEKKLQSLKLHIMQELAQWMNLESLQQLERQLTGQRIGTRQCSSKSIWYISLMTTQTCIILHIHTVLVATVHPSLLRHTQLQRHRHTDRCLKALLTAAPMPLRSHLLYHPHMCHPQYHRIVCGKGLYQKKMTGIPLTGK